MERMTTCKKVVHWMNVLIPLFRSIVQIFYAWQAFFASAYVLIPLLRSIVQIHAV